MPDRALSSMYIRVNGRGLLVDCGEGTQVGIRRLGWGFRSIEAIMLTHYHGDHCTGLAGLLLSLEKAGKTDDFHIYGPLGLKRVVEGLCLIVPKLSYAVMLHEYAASGLQEELIGLKTEAFPVDHGGIPCYGFRFSLPRMAEFDPDAAKRLNIPVEYWKRLQNGETVNVGGRTVQPRDVTGPERRGISFVFSTDTRPCETLEKRSEGADLLILEGMYGSDEKKPLAVKNHHMMFSEAALIARNAKAAALLLTHYSTSMNDPNEYLPCARDIFENTYTASDGLMVTLRYPKKDEAAWTSLC